MINYIRFFIFLLLIIITASCYKSKTFLKQDKNQPFSLEIKKQEAFSEADKFGPLKVFTGIVLGTACSTIFLGFFNRDKKGKFQPSK